MSWNPELEELERRRARAEEMGGSERVERQHAAGKLTVRELVILESMKMEIPVESPMAGIVRELRVAEGAVVKDGDVIAVIDGN